MIGVVEATVNDPLRAGGRRKGLAPELAVPGAPAGSDPAD